MTTSQAHGPIGCGSVEPKVTVLLCTYNGERHLEAQLATLAAQTLPNIDIRVSDDGSNDATCTILQRWAKTWTKGKFIIANGPRRGFSENFRSLLVSSFEADYIAFCDQDDLWDPDKLEHACTWLSRHAANTSGVYGSRTRLIDNEGRQIGFSPLFKKPPAFQNCLVQSLAGGNTIVFNQDAQNLIREASRRTSFVSHDWWCFLLVTGSGGVAHYEPKPRIGYRQHSGNLVGENGSLSGFRQRIKRAWAGQFSRWNEENVRALNACADLLTQESQNALRMFAKARSGYLLSRLRALRRAGVYRQGIIGRIFLYAACIFRRL